MIWTLLVTLIVEGAVAVGYALWCGKPLFSITLTGASVNLGTQFLLWMVLNLFFHHYLLALLTAEILVWLVESVVLCCWSANRLRFTDAMRLSLCMNLASFTLGWFLPV